MTDTKSLLEIRREIKNRKPIFIRQDNPKRMKLNYKWRKPKGIHSKIRHKFKGRRKMPSPGYKSPRKVKDLHSSGVEMVRVSSVLDLDKVKKGQGIIVSKSTGARKRLDILKKANELKISVLNLNADGHIKKIEDILSSKKKARQDKTQVRQSKKEEPKKDEAKKEAAQEESPEVEESKKDQEKKDKDKILTKKV